jgi:hypothetical protein
MSCRACTVKMPIYPSARAGRVEKTRVRCRPQARGHSILRGGSNASKTRRCSLVRKSMDGALVGVWELALYTERVQILPESLPRRWMGVLETGRTVTVILGCGHLTSEAAVECTPGKQREYLFCYRSCIISSASSTYLAFIRPDLTNPERRLISVTPCEPPIQA